MNFTNPILCFLIGPVKQVIVALIFLSCHSLSWAMEYELGNLTCKNFEEAKTLYEQKPKSSHLAANYAVCLLLKGKSHQALTWLQTLVKKDKHIPSAFFIAEYFTKAGYYSSQTPLFQVNTSIEVYLKVLSLINQQADYPGLKNLSYEEDIQIELKTYQAIMMSYYSQFILHFLDSVYQVKSLDSSKDIPDFPLSQNQAIETLKSLDKIKEQAHTCRHLPKKAHFKSPEYNYVKDTCLFFENTVQLLKPLEQKRLFLIEKKLTQQKHEEYKELENKINNIIEENSDKLVDIFLSHKL